jgi:N-acetylmuramoyl-L-alanine amidase
MRSLASVVPIVFAASVAAGPAVVAQDVVPRTLYLRATERERAVRDLGDRATIGDLRAAIRAYEQLVRRFPRSGYCDDALWQAGQLALLAYERFGEEADRRVATRLFGWLRSEYPASRWARQVDAPLARLRARATAGAPPPAAAREPEPRASATVAPAPAPVATVPAAPPTVAPSEPSTVRSEPATLVQLTRQRLPAGVRVILELDAEVPFREERLANPPRVFFDLKGVRVGDGLRRDTLATADEVIRTIRIGQRPEQVTRVVMELVAEARYSVFALYDPFRLVVDFDAAPAGATAAAGPEPPVSGAATAASVSEAQRAPSAGEQGVLRPSRAAPPTLVAPAAPARNSDGKFSLARQLGLGISRIVIDPGHGGHDPGARAAGLTEAEIVLDIALRLETLLAKEPGVEVVLTRRTDVFVPLEERTAIANREAADLFLSIHVNASRNAAARGIETYYLNFATDPSAEAVAARENSASGRLMRSLPEMVQAIALNNKLNESRDFAHLVQRTLVKTLRPQYRHVRDLGVKQAPFVVLIGAQMPSVLAEVAFITNTTEAALLGRPAYRQRLAQALFDAVLGYQRALKRGVAVAQRTTQ